MDQQLDQGKGKVGLGVCRDFSHLLQQFLDGVVSLGNLVVFRVEDRQVEAKIVVLVHLLKVGISAFLHTGRTILQQRGIAIVD